MAPSVELSPAVLDITPLYCDETQYYEGGNPSSGTLVPNKGILQLLDVGILFTGELTQWRKDFYKEYLQKDHIVLVDDSFPTERIAEYARKSRYSQANLENGVLTIPSEALISEVIEGWADDTQGNHIYCSNNQSIDIMNVDEKTKNAARGIRVQKHLNGTVPTDILYYVIPETLQGLPNQVTFRGISIQEASTYNGQGQVIYEVEAILADTPDKKVTFQVTKNSPLHQEKITLLDKVGLLWWKLWRPQIKNPETMPKLPPELTAAIDAVVPDGWQTIKDDFLELDKDFTEEKKYKDKIEDRDGNLVKVKVTKETTSKWTLVSYTDSASGETKKVKVIKEHTTFVYTSREDNTLIKTVEYETTYVTQKGRPLYQDTHKKITYPPSADGSVPEEIKEEKSFEDYTQEIKTHQRTGDDGKPYQTQHWLGTIDLSVGAGVMGGLSTLGFYDEEASGNLLAVGSLIGGELRTPWHYLFAVDLGAQAQQESYASDSGSTELTASWAPTIRPYWTFVGYSSQQSQDDIKNNWSVGITIPQTYHLSSWARPAPMDGHLTYGSTGFRVRNPERPIWLANGIGLRGRWFPANQQHHSVILFLTAEESRGTIYGNYSDLVIETSDGTVTNPATATTAYGWGPVGAAYYTYSF